MNGKGYETDRETLEVINSVIVSAKESGDFSAITAIMGLGLKTKRIIAIS